MSGILSDAIVGDLPKKEVDTILSIVRQVTRRMNFPEPKSHAKLGPTKQNYNFAVDKSLIHTQGMDSDPHQSKAMPLIFP